MHVGVCRWVVWVGMSIVQYRFSEDFKLTDLASFVNSNTQKWRLFFVCLPLIYGIVNAIKNRVARPGGVGLLQSCICSPT